MGHSPPPQQALGWEGLAGDQSLVPGPDKGAWDSNAECGTPERWQELGTCDQDTGRALCGVQPRLGLSSEAKGCPPSRRCCRDQAREGRVLSTLG